MKQMVTSLTLARSGQIWSQQTVTSYSPGNNHDDASLARLVSEGDRGALEQVFETYGGAVKAMAMRVLRDEVLAEDVVQDVFVTFWRKPQKFNAAKGSLRTFLVTLAHRRAVDTVRSEEARSRREEKNPERDLAPDVEDEVWTRSLSETVRDALDTLSEPEREAITLAYFGGLSYIEVAKKLGAPEGTVKSRIRAGMKKLSSELAEVAP